MRQEGISNDGRHILPTHIVPGDLKIKQLIKAFGLQISIFSSNFRTQMQPFCPICGLTRIPVARPPI